MSFPVHMKSLLMFYCRRIILDGEMLVWDPVSERNLPFGTLKTAALDRSKKEYNPRPCCKCSFKA